MDINKILSGEFVHPDYQTYEEADARKKHIVHRLANVTSVAAVDQEFANAKHTPAVWEWEDGSYTVVDIRPR